MVLTWDRDRTTYTSAGLELPRQGAALWVRDVRVPNLSALRVVRLCLGRPELLCVP